MRLAIFLSGRVKQYETFLHLLQKNETKYEIDVFISVNDIYSGFYEELGKRFGKYLKGFNCEEYNVPENFQNVWYNKIEGQSNFMMNNFEKNTAAYRSLSCFFNDTYCFYMATKYADDNNFEYDIYLRFRSDIITDDFPDFDIAKVNENILFSVTPVALITLAITENPDGEIINGRYHGYGDIKHHGKHGTCDIAYGNKYTMSVYCSCYDYILKQNIVNKGNYYICFDHTMLVFLEESDIQWEYFQHHYVYVDQRN